MIEFLSDPNAFESFESTYLRLREKEGRLLNDEQLRALPYISGLGEQLDAEWKFRARSLERLKKYFSHAKNGTKLLDLGCGNGWTAAALAENRNLQISAVDVNRLELEQADRVFSRPNLRYFFGDIFSDIFEPGNFHFIVMNACLQYFPDIDALISRLFYFLETGGEIHIVDTPIYCGNQVASAKKRSESYYSKLGFPEMAANYYHHSREELKQYDPEQMNKRSWLERSGLKKVPGNLQWIKIKKC